MVGLMQDDTDLEMTRYDEAARIKQYSGLSSGMIRGGTVQYDPIRKVDGVYINLPSGGKYRVGDRPVQVAQADMMTTQTDATAAAPAAVVPTAMPADPLIPPANGRFPIESLVGKGDAVDTVPMEDYISAGYTEAEGLQYEKFKQDKLIASGKNVLYSGPPLTPDQMAEYAKQPGSEMASDYEQPGFFDGTVSETIKSLVRGGILDPVKFVTDLAGETNRTLFQIVDPQTGEFDPQIRIVSAEEMANIMKMPFAPVGLEDMFKTSEEAGAGAKFVGSVGQFVGAFAGLGKFFKIGKGYMANATRAGAADYLGFQGDSGRASDFGADLLLHLGVPENKVFEFMRTDPNDPDYIGRFKNALEGFFLGGLVDVIGPAFRLIKEGGSTAKLGQAFENLRFKAKQVAANSLSDAMGVGRAVAAGDTRMLGEIFQPAGTPRSLGAAANEPPVTRLAIKSEGGLPISSEKGAENLRLHRQRLAKITAGTATEYPGAPKNPRTVIPPPEGTNLPTVVVGKIEPNDWQQRIESAMTREQITKAATWYKSVFGEFQKQAKGDPKTIARLTDAWFAGQQNSSPMQTLNDVLYVFEQVNRGVPKAQLKGKGLPSANKIVIDILTESPIEGGAGQKIADFLDSGYGKNVRSIMGNDPEGGQPFVVDIHTARDTGLVDEIYINHLKRLGYNVPEGIVTDVGDGGIKGAQYENRAMFGQQLTNHLNAQSWMGRSDWEPAEIQAVGWMQLSGMYGLSNTGGDVVDAFIRNTRNISMEVDPGAGSPWAEKFGADYGTLSIGDRRSINNEVTAKAIELVNKQTGITLGSNVHGTGGWELFQNPSTVQQAIASKDTAIAAAARLGYLLQQTEVWVNAPKAMTLNPQNFSIDILETSGTSLRDGNRLTELFEAIIADDPNNLFRGYQPIFVDGKTGIRIIITDDAVKSSPLTKAQAVNYIQEFSRGRLSEITKELNFDAEVDIMEADLTRLRNDWTEEKTGGSYKGYFGGQSGKDAPQDNTVLGVLDTDGAELEALFIRRIRDAQGKQGDAQQITAGASNNGGRK